MSREDDPLFYRLVEEFEGDKDGWIYEDLCKFIRWIFSEIWMLNGEYESVNRSNRMALGYVIMLPREQRDTLWAKFRIEKGDAA